MHLKIFTHSPFLSGESENSVPGHKTAFKIWILILLFLSSPFPTLFLQPAVNKTASSTGPWSCYMLFHSSEDLPMTLWLRSLRVHPRNRCQVNAGPNTQRAASLHSQLPGHTTIVYSHGALPAETGLSATKPRTTLFLSTQTAWNTLKVAHRRMLYQETVSKASYPGME